MAGPMRVDRVVYGSPAMIRPALIAGHRQTCGEPLDVPFEGCWQRFVEIVDVENGRAFGRGVGAEVR